MSDDNKVTIESLTEENKRLKMVIDILLDLIRDVGLKDVKEMLNGK